jgi:hypothetical protein
VNRLPARFLISLVFTCAFFITAKAQDFCPQREAILSLSDIVLADRAALPALAARRYGAEAAYLKIRYTPLSEQETRGLLQTLFVSKIRAADDLAYAWYITRYGYSGAVAQLGDENFNSLIAGAGISTIRAMLLSGDRATNILMDRIAAGRISLFSSAAIAVVDHPDNVKERVASAAEAHGLPIVAAYVVASEKNPQAWDAFLTRQSGQGNIQNLTKQAFMMPAVVGNPILRRSGITDASADVMYNRIVMSVAFEPESDFLNTLVNQTGRVGAVDMVATILTRQITDGTIKRNGTLDNAWLLAYRHLSVLIGRSELDSFLDITAYSGSRYVRSNSIFMLRDVIDQLLAVETLQPYMTGKIDTIPTEPIELSNKMKSVWPHWGEVASLIRNGKLSPDLAKEPETFGIATELLLAKGELAALRTFIELAPAGAARATIANDLAMRLDRTCTAYLSRPGEALLLPGQSLFKFDTE